MFSLVSCISPKSKTSPTPKNGPAIRKEINSVDEPMKKIQLPKEDKSDFYKKWALTTGVISVFAYKILVTKGLI